MDAELHLDRKPSERKKLAKKKNKRVVVTKWIDEDNQYFINVGPDGEYHYYVRPYGTNIGQPKDKDTNYRKLRNRVE